MMPRSDHHQFSESPTDKELLLAHESGRKLYLVVFLELRAHLKAPSITELVLSPPATNHPDTHAVLVTAYTVIFIFLVLPQRNELADKIYCIILLSAMSCLCSVYMLRLVASKPQLELLFLTPRRRSASYTTTRLIRF